MVGLSFLCDNDSQIMQNFWKELDKPFFVLAPMEAVTDTVFRHVIAQATPPDVYFTEFTNATGWVAAGERAIGTRLVKTDDEHPIVAQLWGSDPVAMAILATHCQKLGFDGIDINTGCPDSSAIKSGSGAALIHNPELISALITAAKTSGLPVSVKTRLGYSTVVEMTDWLSHLLRQDISALTVHLRTKKEMSKVPAHWELMPEIKVLRDTLAAETLLIGNGDVIDRTDGMKYITHTGIDGIMIGRGIFHNPFGFEKIRKSHNREELLILLHSHLDLHDRLSASHGIRQFDPLKRFFKIYVRDFPDAAALRDSLMHTRSTDEVRRVLSSSYILDGVKAGE